MTATCQCLFAPKLDKKVFKVSIESNLNGNNWLCKLDNFQQCFNQEICFRKLCALHMLQVNFVLQKSNCTIVNLHLVQRSQLLHIITKVTNKTLYSILTIHASPVPCGNWRKKQSENSHSLLCFFLGYFSRHIWETNLACSATLNTPNPVLWVKWNSWLLHIMTK